MHQLWYAMMHSHGSCYGMQGAIRLLIDARATVCHKLLLGLESWGCCLLHVGDTGHHHQHPLGVLQVQHVLPVGFPPVTELVASPILPKN
mgnify:CR=1 FL=1